LLRCTGFCPNRPDLVISGINFGANLGENVYYSGTVGAAREAALASHSGVCDVFMLERRWRKILTLPPGSRVTTAELVLKEGLARSGFA